MVSAIHLDIAFKLKAKSFTSLVAHIAGAYLRFP